MTDRRSWRARLMESGPGRRLIAGLAPRILAAESERLRRMAEEIAADVAAREAEAVRARILTAVPDLVEPRLAALLTETIDPAMTRQRRETIEQTLAMTRAEYTVMPRFAFHQPLDYLAETPAPAFGPPVTVPGEPLPLPPVEERMGYTGTDAEYLAWGRTDAGLVRDVIERHLGQQDGLALLDFGCSSGRVLRHFWPDAQDRGWRLAGVDVQARPIAWMRENFPPAIEVFTGTVMPHLPLPDSSLDVIYGFSVFTHIKYLADMWLMELRRVLRPGGLLIQTIHTEHAWRFYHESRHEPWVRAALPARVLDTPEMDVPYFHYGDIGVSQTFWRRDAARALWGRYLEVLEMRPPPERSFQDWIIARRPG